MTATRNSVGLEKRRRWQAIYNRGITKAVNHHQRITNPSMRRDRLVRSMYRFPVYECPGYLLRITIEIKEAV